MVQCSGEEEGETISEDENEDEREVSVPKFGVDLRARVVDLRKERPPSR